MLEEEEWAADKEEDELNEVDVQQESLEAMEDTPEISLHAITEAPNPRTRRLVGRIGKSEVVILVDTSNTHNFLDSTMIERNQMPILQTKRVKVKLQMATLCGVEDIVIKYRSRCRGALSLQTYIH